MSENKIKKAFALIKPSDGAKDRMLESILKKAEEQSLPKQQQKNYRVLDKIPSVRLKKSFAVSMMSAILAVVAMSAGFVSATNTSFQYPAVFYDEDTDALDSDIAVAGREEAEKFFDSNGILSAEMNSYVCNSETGFGMIEFTLRTENENADLNDAFVRIPKTRLPNNVTWAYKYLSEICFVGIYENDFQGNKINHNKGLNVFINPIPSSYVFFLDESSFTPNCARITGVFFSGRAAAEKLDISPFGTQLGTESLSVSLPEPKHMETLNWIGENGETVMSLGTCDISINIDSVADGCDMRDKSAAVRNISVILKDGTKLVIHDDKTYKAILGHFDEKKNILKYCFQYAVDIREVSAVVLDGKVFKTDNAIVK